MLPIIAFLLSTLAQILTATPIPTNNSSCEPPLKLSPSNWQCYNVDKFLATWWSQHAVECENQQFFYCFAYYYNTSYMLCDGIGSQCDPGELDGWTHGIESYYILVAIANINQYFTDLYNAINAASIIITEKFPNLSNQLNAPHGGVHLWYKEMSSAMLGLLWLVKIFPYEPTLLGMTAFSDYNLAAAVKVDKQFINFAKCSNELGQLISGYQDAIAAGLHNSLSNFSTFSTFVSNGSLFYGNYAGVNITQQVFKTMFESYLTDKMINIILRSKGIFAVVTSQSKGSGHRAPPGQWDAESHIFWTDPNFRLSSDGSYPIWDLKSKNHIAEDNKNIDRLLFVNHDPLTTPEKVFGLSWKCQNQTGQLGGGFKDFDFNHPFDVNDCLYNLPVCITNNQDWGNPNRRPFLNCPYDYDPVNT